MDRAIIIQELQALLELLKKRESAHKEFQNAESALQAALKKCNTAKEEYDALHLEPYIESKVGVKPEAPKGILNQKLIVSPAKRKAYKIDLAAYERLRTSAERAYYDEHADAREQAEKEEQIRIDEQIKKAELYRAERRQIWESLNLEIQNNNLLPDKFKTPELVQEFLDYFLDERVDTIREAINLHFEELHRRKLEEFAEQQTQLIEEAAESARRAAEDAAEAIERADEAIRRADEAYDLASDAYDEARKTEF